MRTEMACEGAQVLDSVVVLLECHDLPLGHECMTVKGIDGNRQSK